MCTKEAQCLAFLDRAVLGSGVNLVDTAEQPLGRNNSCVNGPNNRIHIAMIVRLKSL